MKNIKHTRIFKQPNRVVDVTKLNGKKWLTRAQAEEECVAIDNINSINYIIISQFSEINPN